jgi:hypothetical protein
VTSKRCQDEEPLPAFIDFNGLGNYHLHGEFKTNFSSVDTIDFTTTQDSYIRIVLNELDVADVDILLMRGDVIVGHSMNVFEQEMIAEVLPRGHYTIEFHTFAFAAHLGADEIAAMCQSITVEVAISPVALTRQRRKALPATYSMIGQVLPPAFDFSSISSVSVEFDSTKDAATRDRYNVQVRANQTGELDQLFAVQRWDFQILHNPGSSPMFQLEVSLGYDFLTGGSLFLLLDQADADGHPQCQYGDLGSGSSNATSRRPCKVGQNLVQNVNTIKTQLSSGNYSLWIFDRVGRRFRDENATQRSPDPISFYLSLKQNNLKENLMSCDAVPLPGNLNVPGLVDETGYVSFRRDVLLNLDAKMERTRFTVDGPSLFRIWSEPHRVDIDFHLYENGIEIARSTLGTLYSTSFFLLSFLFFSFWRDSIPFVCQLFVILTCRRHA